MRKSHRRRAMASVALAAATAMAVPAEAQTFEAPPPIAVPTTPVPQTATPIPQTPPAPPPPPAKPKPAPAPAPPPKSKPADPPKGDKKDEPSEKKPVQYNNEGIFKVSGGGGSGYVAPTGKQPKAQGGKTAAVGAKGVAKKTAAIVAQWPGFRMTDDGGSEVMVEFSREPGNPTEHKAAGSITYVFKGAHVIKSNNQNPLLTVHFNTPVLSARLAPKKGELHLVVDLRPGANPAVVAGLRASSDGDGQQFFVKFSAGSWLPAGAENDQGPVPTQKLKIDGKKKKDDNSSAKPATSATPAAPPKTDGGSKTGPKE